MPNQSASTSFEEELQKRAEELKLSARWGVPSILLAVYESSLEGADAVAKLEERLRQQGQHVRHVAPNLDGKRSIVDEIRDNENWGETVFFIMHLEQSSDENIYEKINEQSDFFVNNRLRVVYWLTESDLIAYVQNSPEYLFSQHRLVEFSSSLLWEKIWAYILENISKFLSNKENDPHILKGNSLSKLLAVAIRDDREGVVSRSYLLIKLGVFYFHQEKYARALAFLNKAIELAEILEDQEFSVASQVVLALVQTELKQYDEALLTKEKILSSMPVSSDVLNNLAKLYYSLFMFSDSLSAYQAAIEIAHDNAISWQGIGEAHLQLGQIDKAIWAFNEALYIAPNVAQSWKSLGKTYLASGNNADAVDCFIKSLEIDSQQPDLWCDVGNLSNDKVAQNAFLHAIELGDNKPSTWNSLGNIYYRNQNTNKAIHAYYQAIRTQKDSGWAYANMALIYTQLKQYKSAILLYNKSIQTLTSEADKSNVLYKLGNAYKASDRYSDAVGAYREASKRHQGNNLLDKRLQEPGPFERSDSRLNKNKTLKRENAPEVELAEDVSASSPVHVFSSPHLREVDQNTVLRKVLSKNPAASKATYWLELGRHYIKKRMYELAEDAFLITIELDPNNGPAYYNLAKLNTLSGSYQEAVPLYEKSIHLFEKEKDKALSWNQLGNVYRRLNEPSLAVAAYENARILELPQSSLVSRARLSLMSNCYAE